MASAFMPTLMTSRVATAIASFQPVTLQPCMHEGTACRTPAPPQRVKLLA
ncbi:hypothetical protein [Candidatus Chloroploca asiatica]|nr:hypothetical protein [Candidatus Chloroploca asiatica]